MCDSFTLCDLPHSVLLHVFSFLRIQDVINSVRQTCHLWHSLSYDRSLWKHLDLDNIADHLTDQTFLALLESISQHVEKLDFGMAVHLTDVSFMHKDIRCPHLKSINFSLTTVSNGSIAYIAEKYPELESIEINDCSYINIYHCLSHLSTLKGLKSVSLDDFGCAAEPDRLNLRLKDLFQSCQSLEKVVIDSEELSDEALACLFQNCPNIESIVLAHCQCLSQDAFTGVRGTATNIVNIGLAYTPVEDKVLKIIAECSPLLEELDITGCIHITDVGIGHVAENCPNLRKLIGNRLHHEGGCNITNTGLSMIANGCPRLQFLDVNFCSGVTDIGIIEISEHCKELREIGLSGCVGITDRAVIALAEHCMWLYHVNLTECVQITSKGINQLMSKCKWLRVLSLETCHYLAKLNLDEHLGCAGTSSDSNICELVPQAVPDSSMPTVASPQEHTLATDHCSGATAPESTSNKAKERSIPAVQTFSTFGSSLCMDISCDGAISLAVPHLMQYADEQDDKVPKFPDPDFEPLPPVADEPQEEEEEYTVEVASVNRFTPHPNHSHLTSIHLSFCSKIANDSIKQIGKHCPDLMDISLRGCFLITDSAVEVLVKSCRNLHFMDISGGSAIQSMKLTNGSLIAIANYSRSLKSLMICRNKLITLNGMQRILNDCTSLCGVWITVGDKLKITFSGILELVKDIDDRYVKITNTSQVEANGRQGNLCISLIPKRLRQSRLLHA